jgi:uncharacterized protein (DUF58 family)
MKGDYWLFAAVILLIISLAMHQVALLLLALFFLLTGGASRLWNRYCLNRIEYKRTLSRNRVFWGEELVFEIDIANRKPLPLPWIQIEDELPKEVTFLKGKTSVSFEDRIILNNIFPINWYHRVKRRFPVRCMRRGYFAFGPTVIRSGDLFGFFKRELRIPQLDYLMVYPRLVSLEKLGIPSKQLFGDIRLKTHLFQDPVLTAGVRDYHYGDSLKRIHWKSTARRGELQTKVYEPTTTVDLSLFLDVRTLEAPYWGSVFQLQETGIIAAASIAREALEEGFRVGLNVNQLGRYTSGIIRVPHSQHAEQLVRILEALAQLHQTESTPIDRFIQQEAGHLPWGSTLVVITAQPSDELIATLLDLKRAGRSVALIKIGGSATEPASDNFHVYHVSEKIAWDVMEKLDMKGP